MKRTSLVFTLSLSLALHTYAQKTVVVPVKTIDSVQKTLTVSKLGTYSKVIPSSAKSMSGMFSTHLVDSKWYFEIPDTLLKRYILAVTRYVSMPQGMNLYGGEKANEQTIYFEKGQGNKLLLRACLYKEIAADTNQAIRIAVNNSNVNPIVAIFDIKAVNPENNNMVIEVTDFFRKESPVVSLSNSVKTETKLGSIADDRSFLNTIRSYPINIEIKTTKTYQSTATGIPAAALTGSVTLDLNTSLVLLPKVPMRKRLFDERVGYFTNSYSVFADDSQDVEKLSFIQRYRLEPKAEDIEKYKRGELVEPKKQIVYYIDPATPKKWRPYLIAGVNDWQKAFEQAGFKNAIIGKEWPESDTTMSLEDARFSVIRYFASEKANAYGPRISDPRSGEIIESHVGWYHSVMRLLHSWYMLQAGAIDPRARKNTFDDELMGDLIRFVSSHEIGHTIGLRHNMGASSQTPVENLRNKKWVEANGHTVSIMDYARFNYVAQPEDHIGKEGIYPRIGMYDKWAIEWGYKNLFGTNDEKADRKILNKLIVDSLAANPKLWFGGEGKNEDPRSQTEDLGDNAMKASDYGLKNLKRVVPQLISWTAEDGDLYENLKKAHKGATAEFSRFLYHVMKNMAGQYVTQKSVEETGPVFKVIEKERVKEVIDYVGRNVFNAPLWLYPKEITSRINVDPVKDIMAQQNQMLMMFFSPAMVYNMFQIDMKSGYNYPVPEYLKDLHHAVWKEFNGNPVENMYRRNVERVYIERLAALINTKSIIDAKIVTEADRSDVHLYARQHALWLRKHLGGLKAKDAIDKTHVKEMKSQLDQIIKYK
ncbi:zinc-dependent metalloprotease [Pedobacter sp. AW31-3R]|uniref:zinc-dependent metalloprotease n=1 Tax=Pedobacter sp. AW31-3R TaxID=3445781 RepID=UPI003F9FE4CC